MRKYKNNITSSSENIISFFKNITNHFIGKVKIITLISTTIMLSFVNITLYLSNISNTSALSYSGNVNIGFTFNPTISLNISPSNLVISDLTPGTAAESNIITVNIATNTAYGYNLTANVGSNTTNYNTTNLVHASSATSTPTTNATFASLAYGASITNKDNLPTNTWGYSYSDDSGTTWQSYSGLPLYSDTEHSVELISTYNPANSKSIDFKIAANANNTQPSGEYTNIINFYAVSNPEPPTLYDTVRYMTKGTLVENNVKLSDTITQANSGVYTYDPAVYGVASDASNDYPIYFYRGILDTDAGLGTYGSDGQADAWPNYVKLSNGTCWRIVRTTGSGGTKMIYNGIYGATTAGSCVNDSGNAQISTAPFNTDSWSSYNGLQYQNMHAVGYTYSNIATGTTTITLSALLGASGDDITTDVNSSIIKQYIEDWYRNNMSTGNYTGKLEFSAGYCNDRTVYNESFLSINNRLAETTTVIPYGTADMTAYRFGSYARNMSKRQMITFNCPRGKVDLYSAGSGNNGNGQLTYPIALLTADETAFSGSGNTSGDMQYDTNSYLVSGDFFWLLSPDYRASSDGSANGIRLHPGGYPVNGRVSYSAGVRPVISLMHHIQVTSGIGTATSPWTIE